MKCVNLDLTSLLQGVAAVGWQVQYALTAGERLSSDQTGTVPHPLSKGFIWCSSLSLTKLAPWPIRQGHWFWMWTHLKVVGSNPQQDFETSFFHFFFIFNVFLANIYLWMGKMPGFNLSSFKTFGISVDFVFVKGNNFNLTRFFPCSVSKLVNSKLALVTFQFHEILSVFCNSTENSSI